MTIKMQLSNLLFFLCFRPTIKFQDGSPIDPVFDPPADPPFDSTSRKMIFIVISASLNDGHLGPCQIKNTTVIFIHYGGGKKYDGSKIIRQGL